MFSVFFSSNGCDFLFLVFLFLWIWVYREKKQTWDRERRQCTSGFRFRSIYSWMSCEQISLICDMKFFFVGLLVLVSFSFQNSCCILLVLLFQSLLFVCMMCDFLFFFSLLVWCELNLWQTSMLISFIEEEEYWSKENWTLFLHRRWIQHLSLFVFFAVRETFDEQHVERTKNNISFDSLSHQGHLKWNLRKRNIILSLHFCSLFKVHMKLKINWISSTVLHEALEIFQYTIDDDNEINNLLGIELHWAKLFPCNRNSSIGKLSSADNYFQSALS